MLWTIIGLAAATLTMFAFIPQIIKAAKTKSVKDVSPLTLFQLSCGVLLWVIYGIYRQDFIIITANLVTLATLAVLIFMYFAFERKK